MMDKKKIRFRDGGEGGKKREAEGKRWDFLSRAARVFGNKEKCQDLQ